MKNLKYLNAVLTVIAVCLVIITISVLGLIPKANAASNTTRFVSVPLNADGSLNVKIVDQSPLPVDITHVAGQKVTKAYSRYGTEDDGSIPVRKN